MGAVFEHSVSIIMGALLEHLVTLKHISVNDDFLCLNLTSSPCHYTARTPPPPPLLLMGFEVQNVFILHWFYAQRVQVYVQFCLNPKILYLKPSFKKGYVLCRNLKQFRKNKVGKIFIG